MGSGMAVSRSSAAPRNTWSHVSKTWTEWDASIKFVKRSDLKTGAKEKNMAGFLRTRQNRKCQRQEAKQSRRLITLEKLVNVGETQWNVWSNQIWKRICFCFSRSRQRWWSFCDAGWLWSQGAESAFVAMVSNVLTLLRIRIWIILARSCRKLATASVLKFCHSLDSMDSMDRMARDMGTGICSAVLLRSGCRDYDPNHHSKEALTHFVSAAWWILVETWKDEKGLNMSKLSKCNCIV